MNKSISRQKGFALKAILGVVALVGITTVAYPKYEVMLVKSKMAEAMTLASDAKTKLNEYYIMNNRFPRSRAEAGSIQTKTLTKPKFVSNIKINYKDKDNDVLIEVYFNEGEIPETDASTDFVYLAGNSSRESGSLVEWTCGSKGIDEKYMPSTC